MARDRKDIDRLAKKLTSLKPEERARLIAKVRRTMTFKPPPRVFSPPVLNGGTKWVGGSLRREEMYGDDGR